MSRAIKMGGAGGGSGSDDVTAAKTQLLENYTAITKDSDDEPGTGTMKHLTNRATITHETNNGTKVLVGDVAYMVKNSDGVQRAEIRYNGSDGYVTPNTLFAIPAGTMATAGGMTAAKVLAGQSAFGISGTATNDATATASQMLAGATAYVKGAKVTGNIASKGAATYTPGTSAQTIAAGQYLNGVQTIAAIPSNYYNANNMQTVFSNGSYGLSASLGAYHASGSNTYAWNVRSDLPAKLSSEKWLYLGYASTDPKDIIFRAAFPPSLGYISFLVHRFSLTADESWYINVINPSTLKTTGRVSFRFYDENPYDKTFTLNLSTYTSILSNGWFLGIQGSDSGRMTNIILSPTAF